MSDEDDRPEEDSHTVFSPSERPPAPTPAPDPPPEAVSSPPPTPQPEVAPVPPPTPGRVEVGAVLNHIYEVKRFIARGGMGEVFEGANVNSDERVAIKVMLPQLAADPNVQEMFRKEARTLTKLSHPAVVQYRLLAQEPQLGVLYIVTEFIDGASLADVMHSQRAGEPELRMLLRRLAEGLKAAHELGAVHRDISPDNVLLPEGRLDRAKIIDFGIAKDLDPSKGTIVGDGFAGKLGYVAPEQFGDFGREVGPWTDVYSLGLVILAAAIGKDVDMGATLVEAIDKRRAGPDLAAIPDGLRPVLARMLKPDPAERMRSMDEVLAALDQAPAAAPAPPAESTVFAPSPKKPSPSQPPDASGAGSAATGAKPGLPRPVIFGAAGVGALVLIGAVVLFALPKHAAKPAQAATAAAAGVPKAEAVRRELEGALGGIACSWLDLTNVADQGSGVSIKLAGVAGSPTAAQASVIHAVGQANATVSDVSLDEVAPVDPPVCTPLDAFRSIRASTSETGRRLETAQRTYQIMAQSNGKTAGRAVITMNIGDRNIDFALFGLEPDGKITALLTSRAAFEAFLKTPNDLITDLGGDNYRLQIDTDHQGWSGLLLLTGKGPFDPNLVAAPAAQRGADWSSRFRQAASAGNWKAEMVWYKTQAGAG